MQDFSNIIHNHALMVALVACAIAQALKVVVYLIQHRSLNLRALVETGGMPRLIFLCWSQTGMRSGSLGREN